MSSAWNRIETRTRKKVARIDMGAPILLNKKTPTLLSSMSFEKETPNSDNW